MSSRSVNSDLGYEHTLATPLVVILQTMLGFLEVFDLGLDLGFSVVAELCLDLGADFEAFGFDFLDAAEKS